ncbi:MAG: M50 family metallopeptidase [Dehalococcoidales bacterium]|nr:M50 family metallopeptidase [Dehalococcoidales bacterium]
MLLTIVVGLLVLSVLIIAHELGHFLFAKATGVWVEEFGIGFPPRVFGIRRGETVYSLNAIPFGGFNKISGEVDPSAPRSLASKSAMVRIIVIGGGILMNLLLPVVLLSLAFMVPHDIVRGDIIVQQVAPGSPAERAGIQPGDVLTAVNGKALNNGNDLSRFVQQHLGEKITITLKRSSVAREVSMVPRWRPPEGQGPIGTLSRTENTNVIRQSLPFWHAVPIGVTSLWETLVLYKNGIIGMIVGTTPVVMMGPVGIVQVTGEVAQSGAGPVLELAAFISIAIAITQLLPFPALDGGRILFILLEVVRGGKRVSPKLEGKIHAIGFAILFALMLAITFQDILRIIMGESLIP